MTSKKKTYIALFIFILICAGLVLAPYTLNKQDGILYYVKQIVPEKLKLFIKNNFLEKDLLEKKLKDVEISYKKMIENDYILKRNLVNKCKNYIDSFTDRLINIHGNDPQTFKHRLRELDCPQLEILLENIRFEINIDGGKSLFNSAFFMIISQTENLSNNYGYNITGLSKALQANNDVHDSLKELSCQMDLSSYTTPELRLASAVLLTALSCYNTNKLSSTMDSFLNEEINDDIQERFKDL